MKSGCRSPLEGLFLVGLLFELGIGVVPTDAIPEVFGQSVTAVVSEVTVVGGDAVEVTLTTSSKTVDGVGIVFADALTGDDVIVVDFGTEEFDTVGDEGLGLLGGVDSEAEGGGKTLDFGHVFGNESGQLFGGDDREPVVDIMAGIAIAELDNEIAHELVEVDVGESLRSEVANDDTAARGLRKEGLVGWEVVPVAQATADTDAGGRVVENHLAPEKFEGVVEFAALRELAIKTPEDAEVEAFAAEAHEVAAKVTLDDVSGSLTIEANATHFALEVVDTVEGAFAFATRVGAGEQASIPPEASVFEEKVVDNAVDKGGGENFAFDGMMDNKGDAAAGMVGASENSITEVNEIFKIVGLEAMLVGSLAFAVNTGFVIGLEKLS